MTTATKSVNVKRKQRTLNRRRGIPNRVPPLRAARHIQQLRATMSWNDISAASGCSAAHLRQIVNGRWPQINRVTESKILAVLPEARGWIYVPALGTRRRIQALQARGHSQYAIAEAAGTTQYRIYMVSNGQPTVRLHFAEQIKAMYPGLAEREGTSTRGRNMAITNGWAGPEYWDDEDFDNPDFTPALNDDLGRDELAARRRIDIAHLASYGIPEDEIAARLGMATAYVHDLIRGMRKEAA